MSKKVKICGLSRAVDIDVINQYKPDYCGFIIDFPKSHRNIGIDTLEKFTNQLDKNNVTPVGVFVNEPVETVAELLNDDIIRVAQLHGSEDNEYISELKMLTNNATVWQAIQIKSDEDIEKANTSTADFIILDAGQGAGVTFDWSHLAKVNRDYGLAGGLNFDNIGDALKTGATLLDVSGGVETDRLKDAEKIKRFIELVRE